MIKNILLFIGIGFTNPVVPDGGSQFLAAVIIGTVVPKMMVSPLHCFLLKIPLIGLGVQKFEQKLENANKFEIPFSDREIDLKRFKTAFPRLIAGYFFTYIIGGICLMLYFSLFVGGL